MEHRRRWAMNTAFFALMLAVWGWLKWSQYAFWTGGQDWLDYPLLRLPLNVDLAVTPNLLLLFAVIVIPQVLVLRLARSFSPAWITRLCWLALAVLDGSALLMVGGSTYLNISRSGASPLVSGLLYSLLIFPLPFFLSISITRSMKKLHSGANAKMIPSSDPT